MVCCNNKCNATEVVIPIQMLFVNQCRTFVIAPLSAVPLDTSIIQPMNRNYENLILQRGWGLFPVLKVDFHVNLDDVDLNKESLMETIPRVMGRHGLGVWLLVSI